MNNQLVDDLRDQLAHGHVVVVVGAGVSAATTGGIPTASWPGLLRDGVARCEAVVPHALPSGWGDRLRAQIDSSDLEELLSAAENVTRRLGGPSGGEYRRWLRETVGALTVAHPEVIEALAGLGVPITTTNYDNLIEDVTGLPAVTWRQGTEVERVLRGDDRGVVHLHGHWRDPDSVVLGIRSYEYVLGDEHAQAMHRAVAMLQSLLFVGFGAGLGDPNFSDLRAWLSRVIHGSEYRHFRVGRDGELPALQAEHEPAERIMVLGYGPEYNDLAPFLRDLAPPGSLPHAATASPIEISRARVHTGGNTAQLPKTAVGRDLISIQASYWPAGAAQTVAALHQLPSDIVDFTGRRRELNAAIRVLGSSEDASLEVRRLAISGKPGVGKSALAIHVAHLLKSEAPDGEFYYNFRGDGERHITGPYRLDDPPDLTSEDATRRDGVDGRGLTSNP